MTDHDPDATAQEIERAERIRRWQERRGTAAPARGAPRPRRRHHYNASRTVLAGLSVTGFFTILAAFGLSQPSPPATSAPPAAPASTPAAGTTATAPQTTTPSVSAATPSHRAPAPRAVTRSHGS
jgi:hypothetical protein